jgi:hypothetical protein
MFRFDFKLLDIDHRTFFSMHKSFADLSKNPNSNAQCSVPHQPGSRAFNELENETEDNVTYYDSLPRSQILISSSLVPFFPQM